MTRSFDADLARFGNETSAIAELAFAWYDLLADLVAEGETAVVLELEEKRAALEAANAELCAGPSSSLPLPGSSGR